MQSTAIDPEVTTADKSAHTAQADAQQQSRTPDTSIQQQQGSEVKNQYVEAHAALRKKQLSVLDEQQQQQEVKSMGLQQPQSLQQVQLASKRQHSQRKRTKPPSSPVKREPAVGDEPAAASISTSISQPHLVQTQQQQQQVPHMPMQTQQKAEALQQQQQVPAQQHLQQKHAEGQQQRIEPRQQQRQQHMGATMSLDSDSAATVLHYTTSISQDRGGAESADDPAASTPGTVLQPTGTVSRAAMQQPPTAGIPAAAVAISLSDASAATAAAAAAAGEMNVSSSTSPSQLMQMIVDQARKMRAEQARKAKELSRANKKLQKLQQQKAELQAQLESQRAFEGIDIENVTVQQLQDMIAKVAEQRREVAEQLAAEERELEVQQQLLQGLQEQDREMDARLQGELLERLELLQQFVQDRMVE